VQSCRYAERPESPAPQIALALGRKRLRFVPRPNKKVGAPGAGWAGTKPEVVELWSMFLRRMSEGLVGVRDEATLAALAGIVEENGQPHYPNGGGIDGRLLAYLLALAGAAAAVKPAAKEGPAFSFTRRQAVGVWSSPSR